jgi:hypothetical protein
MGERPHFELLQDQVVIGMPYLLLHENIYITKDRFHTPDEKLGYHQLGQDPRKPLTEHPWRLDYTFLD